MRIKTSKTQTIIAYKKKGGERDGATLLVTGKIIAQKLYAMAHEGKMLEKIARVIETEDKLEERAARLGELTLKIMIEEGTDDLEHALTSAIDLLLKEIRP